MNPEDRWVADKLAALEPQWSPDYAHGRTLFDARLAKPSRSWHWTAAAAAATVCFAVLALPQTRAVAQQLWYRLILNRVDMIRVDLSKLSLDTHITTNGLQQNVKTVEDAERKAGFRPYLPPDGTLPTNPSLTVIGPIVVEQTTHVRELEAALNRVGARDVRVPAEWEGMRLHTEIGPMVEANYPDDVQILQARPVELSVPAGFPLERFAEVVFRSLGIQVWEARDLAQKFVANPALLLDVPADEIANVQEVSLRSGRALLIEDFDDKGNMERVTVIRSTKDRMYSVSAKTRELSLKIADSLP